MSSLITVLRVFVKPDDKLILFNSYAGRKYDDSPKEIYQVIKNDRRFESYRLVWAFHDPSNFVVDGADKIKTDGLYYFIVALKSRVWVTNSSVERGLNFTGINTFYLNTWHGTPIKKMGSDIGNSNRSFKKKGENHIDIMNVQSEYEAEIFSHCFNMPKDRFLKVGLPRNDKLCYYTKEYRLEIRNKLNIPENKKVILYCPTFREYEKDENYGVIMAPPVSFARWEESLSDDYMLLVRAHYEVSKVMRISDNYFVRNVTDYPSLNELMIASDVLISDYSSVFFDYAIMNKPMFHYTYDYEKYLEKRGVYFDVRDYLSGSANENELIDLLKCIDMNNEIQKTCRFRADFIEYYGNAAQNTVDYIAKMILENS